MRLGLCRRLSGVLVLVAAIAVAAFSQTQKPDNRPANSSIAGQVKAGGIPLPNKTVIVSRFEERGNIFAVTMDGSGLSDLFHSAKTDADGRYRLTGLKAGTYEINVSAAAFAPDKKGGERSRTITLDENEAEENVDFSLARGGVITGRVTDADGRPLIAQSMQLRTINGDGEARQIVGVSSGGETETDDRGVYRVFGLSAGRYIIGVGGRTYNPFGAAAKYPLTYFPGTTDEKQARLIEVAEGSEVMEIDIRLGSASKTYEAIGHVIDAESGQPISKVSLMCFGRSGSDGVTGFSGTATSDAKGEFRFNGLPPGTYTVQLRPDVAGLLGGQSEHYIEETKFEVLDTNISGVQVQAKRGAMLSGVVAIEATPEQKSKINLGQTMIMGIVERKTVEQSGNIENAHISTTDYGVSKLNSDGSFRLTGLPPGKVVSFNLISISNGRQPAVSRIERDGVEMRDGIEIRSGEALTGVKVVLGIASGSIRGQVNLTGGKLPEGWVVRAMASRVNAPEHDRNSGFAEVSSNGRFIIEGLIDGEYEIMVFAHPKDGGRDSRQTEQIVRITSGAETPVTITLDLSKKEQEERQ